MKKPQKMKISQNKKNSNKKKNIFLTKKFIICIALFVSLYVTFIIKYLSNRINEFCLITTLKINH